MVGEGVKEGGGEGPRTQRGTGTADGSGYSRSTLDEKRRREVGACPPCSQWWLVGTNPVLNGCGRGTNCSRRLWAGHTPFSMTVVGYNPVLNDYG